MQECLRERRKGEENRRLEEKLLVLSGCGAVRERERDIKRGGLF